MRRHSDDTDPAVVRAFNAFNMIESLKPLENGVEILPADREIFEQVGKCHAAIFVTRQRPQHRPLNARYIDVLIDAAFVKIAALNKSEK